MAIDFLKNNFDLILNEQFQNNNPVQHKQYYNDYNITVNTNNILWILTVYYMILISISFSNYSSVDFDIGISFFKGK